MSIKNLQELFNEAKNILWSNATVSFYVAKRQLREKKASYQVFHVNTDDELQKKLRDIAINKLNASNQAKEYDYNTSDLNDDVLGIPIQETDFQSILEQITAEEESVTITKYEELLDSWVYIARLDIDGNVLYTVRRLSDGWNTKKVIQIANLIFKDNMLIDLNEKEIFKIDSKVDFLLMMKPFLLPIRKILKRS